MADLTSTVGLTSESILDVLSKAGALFFRWDPSHGLTFISGNIAEMLGYTAEELMGTPGLAVRVVDPSFIPHLEQVASEFFVLSEDAPRIDVPLIARSGKRVVVEARVVPELDSDGHIMGFMGIALRASDDTRRAGGRSPPRKL